MRERLSRRSSGRDRAAGRQVATLVAVSSTFQTLCLDAAVRATQSRRASWPGLEGVQCKLPREA